MATLQTEARELSFSKGELNKFRKAGRIPAVVFGKEVGESKPIFVNLIEFLKIYNEGGKVMEMKIDGAVEMVNAKVIDRTPFGGYAHINFLQLKRGQKTQVKVAITAEGESKGVKAGGILQFSHDKVTVEAVPKDIPDTIHLDVTELEIGDSVTASQLNLPAGVELVDEPDMSILSIQAPQKAEEEPAAEAAEGAEGEAAAAAPEGGADAPAAEAAGEEKS